MKYSLLRYIHILGVMLIDGRLNYDAPFDKLQQVTELLS